jgi:hypothetical protein
MGDTLQEFDLGPFDICYFFFFQIYKFFKVHIYNQLMLLYISCLDIQDNFALTLEAFLEFIDRLIDELFIWSFVYIRRNN